MTTRRQLDPDAPPQVSAPPPQGLADLPTGLDVEQSAINRNPSAQLEGRYRNTLSLNWGMNLDEARQTMPTLGTPEGEVGSAMLNMWAADPSKATRVREGVIGQLDALRAAGPTDPTKVYPTIEVAHATLLAEQYGFEPNAAKQIAYAIADISDESPQIWEFFENDYQDYTSMTEQQLMDEAASGSRDARVSLQMMHAIDEVVSTYAGQGLTATTRFRNTVVAEGSLDEMTGAEHSAMSQQGLFRGPGPRAMRDPSQWAPDSGPTNPAEWGAAVLRGKISNATPEVFDGGVVPKFSFDDIAGRGGSWTVTDGGVLAFQVPYVASGDTEPTQATFAFRLDDGTQVRNAAEAWEAASLAFRGKQHTVLHVDNVPGGQNVFGRLIQTAGGLARIYENSFLSKWKNAIWGNLRKALGASGKPDAEGQPADYQIQWMQDRDIVAAEKAAADLVTAQAYADQTITPTTVTTAMYSALEAEAARQGVEHPSMSAVANEVYAMSESQLSQIEGDLNDKTVEEVMKVLSTQGQGQTRFSEGVMKAVTPLLAVAQEYDLVTQWLGMTVLSGIHNIFAPVVGEDVDGKTVYGLDAFREAVRETTGEHQYISEQLDLEGGWGTGANIAVSTAFDPLNFVLPGAAGSRRWVEAMLSTPELAPAAVRRIPSIRQLLRHVTEQNDPIRTVFGTETMTSDGIAEMVNLSGLTPELTGGVGGAEVLAQAERVVTNQIANHFFMPPSMGRSYATRTAAGIADTFKNFPILGKSGQGRMLATLENLSHGRHAPTRPDEWLDYIMDLATKLHVSEAQEGEARRVIAAAVARYNEVKASGGDAALGATVADWTGRLEAVRLGRGAAGLDDSADVIQYFDDVQRQLDDALSVREGMAADARAAADTAPFGPEDVTRRPNEVGIRFENEPGAVPSADRVNGLFLSPEGTVDHIDRVGAEMSTWEISGDAKILDVSDEVRLSHPRFGYRRSGVVDANVSAIETISGRSELERLAVLSADDLTDEILRTFPNVNAEELSVFAEGGDTLDLLSAYGANLARRDGWDAIRQVDRTTPTLSERVILNSGVASRRTAAAEMLADMDTHIATLRENLKAARPGREAWDAAQAERVAARTAIARSARNLDDPTNAQPLVDFTIELIDSWAERALLRKGYKLEEIWRDSINTLHSDVTRRTINWKLILDPTGNLKHTPRSRMLDQNVSIWAPLYTSLDPEGKPVVNEALKRVLEGSPFHLEIGRIPLPISEYELIAFDATPDIAAWAKIVNSRPVRAIGVTTERFQTALSLDVLVNAITPFRVAMGDVPFRYLAETGDVPGFLRALGVSNPFLPAARTPGIRGLLPSSPQIAQAVREWESSLGGIVGRDPHFTWVYPKDAGHPQAVERWLAGQLGNIPATRVWALAKVSDDPTIFTDWFNNVFLAKAKTRTRPVAGRGGVNSVDMTAQQWFDSVDNGMNMWFLHIADPKARANIRDALYSAWSQGKRLDETVGQARAMAMYRQMGAVPGERMTANVDWAGRPFGGDRGAAPGIGGWYDATMGFLYGGPASAQGSVFMDRFYQNAMSVFEPRFAGRTIDVDFLRRAMPNVPEADLLALMANPPAELRRAAKNAGLVWRHEIEMNAKRWAEKRAKDLMYVMSSASVLGRKSQRWISRFGRAQVDYVRWWMKKMFEPFAIGLSPSAKTMVAQAQDALGAGARLAPRAGERVGVRAATDTVESAASYRPASVWVPQIPKPGGGTMPIPMNVSLWAKFSHVFAAIEKEQQDAAAEAEAAGLDPVAAERAQTRNPPLFSAQGAVHTFTFFPDDLNSNDLMMDIVPQPGFVPILAVMMSSQMLSDDPNNAARNLIEDAFPVFRFYDGDELDSWSDILNIVNPVGPKSIRGELGSLTRLVNPRSGDEGQGPLASMWDFLVGNEGAIPPNLQVHAANLAGSLMSEGDWAFRTMGTDEWKKEVDALVQRAWAEQNTQFAMSRVLAPLVPNWNSRIPQDVGYIQHYKPILDDLGSLAPFLVPPERAEEIRALYSRWENTGKPGNVDLTPTEVDSLANWLNSIIYTDTSTITLARNEWDQVSPEYFATLTLDQRNAFYNTGALPVGLPQEMMDNWLLEHPGLAMNMVSKVRGHMTNGSLDVPERYRPYFYADGGVNSQELYRLGWEEANSLRAEMLGNSILVNRVAQDDNMNGWWQEAQTRVQAAARRDIQRRWEAITLTPWGSGQPSDAVLGGSFIVTPEQTAALGRYGEFYLEGQQTGQTIFDALKALRGGMEPKYPVSSSEDVADRMLQQNATVPAGSSVPSGAELYRLKEWLIRKRMDEDGIESAWDLQDQDKDQIRIEVYERAIELGYLGPNGAEVYRLSGYDRIYGSLGIEPPKLTEVSQLDNTLILHDEEIRSTVEVVDGDTVNINTPDGSQWTIRIQGINAPDRGQYKWQESSDDLQFILDNANEIAFGTFEPDRFGSVMSSDPTSGKRRAKLFLIADGVPIIDPAVYTVSSPQGSDSGVWGYLPPIRQIYMDGVGMVTQ